jgi:cold shock protein
MTQRMTARVEGSVSYNGGVTVAKGTIRRLLEYRGFGFIQSEDGRSVFFHRSEVLRVPFVELHEGQVVEFVVEETPQGPKARRVRVAETAPTSPMQLHG